MKKAIDKRTVRRGILALAALVIGVGWVAGRIPWQRASAERSGAPRVDALRYAMDLVLDTDRDQLREDVTITLQNDTEAPVTVLYLRDMTVPLLQYAKDHYAQEGNGGKTSEISFVQIVGAEDMTPIAYTREESVLRIDLGWDHAIPVGGQASIRVGMQTDIPCRADRFGVQQRAQGKLYALSFCFPYLADNASGTWNMDPYFDDGESRSADLADYSVTIRAPENFLIAATGTAVTEKGITRVEARQVRDFAIVASDFMAMESFDAQGVRINNYYLTGPHEAAYRKMCRLAAQNCFRLFTDKVGSYVYEELDLVQCLFGFAFGGMEFPGLVMINGSSFYDGVGPENGAQSMAENIAHEIAHQWFYAAVGNAEYAEGWLDEGFATYLERQIFSLTPGEARAYVQSLDPSTPSVETLAKEMEEYVRWFSREYDALYVNLSPDDYPPDRSYGEGEYEGGYAFLMEARELLGEKAFGDFLKEYYHQYCLKIAETDDVAALLRQYDDSEDMERLLRFYIR